LNRWQRWLQGVSKRGRLAYVYFDNDQKSAAPKDAAKLAELLPCVQRHRQTLAE
jgi:uncharacterized protein YecE (DUF72 family)